MSLFLGKIHYWLYDKILWFEKIEKDIANWAERNQLPINQWLEEMNQNFGELTDDAPLEDIIDTSNIHGWLQGKISVVEARQAFLVTKILGIKDLYKDDLLEIFAREGQLAAKDYQEEKLVSAEQVYNALNDYILEGMPCDRVNEIIESDEDKIIWERTTCLHETYWNAVGGNVENFYDLRQAWIKAFVDSLEGDYHYEKVTENRQKIYR